MNVPSLCVIFVGGWGVAPISKGNFLNNQSYLFLKEFVSSYPVLCLKSPGDNCGLIESYRQINSCQNIDGIYYSLNSVLQSHDIQRIFISDVDRYGVMATSFRCGENVNTDASYIDPPSSSSENEQWKYVQLPPVESLLKTPETTLSDLASEAYEAFKCKENIVIFLAINTMWTIAKYGNLATTKQAVEATEKKIEDIICRALDANLRILLVSDGGMLENYVNLENQTISSTQTSNALPCLLIHKMTEGIKASPDDLGSNFLMPQAIQGELSDIAPTILSLMNISPHKQMHGKVLFEGCISSTLGD